MKTRIGILAVLIALAAILSQPPRTFSYNWSDEFSGCVDGYGTDWFQCWETGWDANDTCDAWYPPGPDRDACRSQANSDKVTCLASSGTIFGSCAHQIDYHLADLDFCDQARAAADACNNQFQGLDNTEARMNCRAESKIDQCQ